jgi:phage/plasmid-associated DNA primase
LAKVTPYITQLEVPDDEAKEDPRDAHRLAKRVLNSLARVDGQLSWLHWYGQISTWELGRYRPLHEDKLRALVTGALKEHFHERVTAGHDSKAYSVSTNQLSSVLNAIKSVALVNADALPIWVGDREGDPAVFAFRNGLVEIDMALAGNVSLTPLDPRWFSKVCFPFSLDLRARCPGWIAFLERVLPAEDDRGLLQDIFGFCLIADTRYQKFFVLVGAGSNGNSVALTILTELLGDENVSSVPIEEFAERFALESTVDKLANIVNEVEDSKKLPEGIVKKYVSGERITVNRKHLKDIQVKPTARLLLSTNEMPQFKDQSNGMSRRFRAPAIPDLHPRGRT